LDQFNYTKPFFRSAIFSLIEKIVLLR